MRVDGWVFLEILLVLYALMIGFWAGWFSHKNKEE